MLAFIDEHPRLGAIAGKISRDSFTLAARQAASDVAGAPATSDDPKT